ncbi:hypothetical protein [Microbacterium testaceum]|uniref:hypothetical protein n=1 Tax=Microbacterium testaceum TaxID=2033 RepID=UPI00124736B5|nr:hypothetical protein [Microbacterium testaceum]
MSAVDASAAAASSAAASAAAFAAAALAAAVWRGAAGLRGVAGFAAVVFEAADFAAPVVVARAFAAPVFAVPVFAAPVFAAVELADDRADVLAGLGAVASVVVSVVFVALLAAVRGVAGLFAAGFFAAGVRGGVPVPDAARAAVVRGARGLGAGFDAAGETDVGDSTLADASSVSEEDFSGGTGSDAVIAPNYQPPPTPTAPWTRAGHTLSQ